MNRMRQRMDSLRREEAHLVVLSKSLAKIMYRYKNARVAWRA